MNHLAHLWLAGSDPELRIGGFLGDFVRGRTEGRFPTRIDHGIRLHRWIDARTDAHPAVRELLPHFEGSARRWAPVALDVYFDHLLARDFRAITGEDITAFIAGAYRDLALGTDLMPAPALGFFDRMREHDLLGAYVRRDTVDQVLVRVSTRSPRAAPLADMGTQLDRHRSAIEDTFARLRPDLEHGAAAFRNRLDGPV